MSRFVEEFSAFAKAVDFIDNDVLSDIKKNIETYFKNRFGAEFWELLLPVQNRYNQSELKMEWATDGMTCSSSLIYNQEEILSGQSAYCYMKGKPMWVTTGDSKLLYNTNNYQDHWNNQKEIPQYKEFQANTCKTKTSILIPFEIHSNRAVLNIETNQVLSFTANIGKELETLCNAISDIFIKNYTYNRDIKGTKEINSQLRDLSSIEVKYGPIPLFLASSDRAKDDVIATIRSIISEYGDKFKLLFWKSSEESGDINRQIIKELHSSKLSICYLSEPSKENNKYNDNPNVVFETGFLQACTYSEAGNSSAWIPIREKRSPPPPFDLRGERIVYVERNDDFKLNTEALKQTLRERIEKILESF